jgi:hypothetical protein
MTPHDASLKSKKQEQKGKKARFMTHDGLNQDWRDKKNGTANTL